MHRVEETTEDGFMLVGLIVAIFLILLALTVAAPRVAKELRREREVESIRRGQQYVRAIQLYFRKTGHYPGSLDQLEKTNNIRFLRQRYVDPMTGKADWRLIHQGEAKTTVRGFFGKPLSGIATGGLGSVAGMVAPGAPGSSSAPSQGSSFGGAGAGANSTGSSFGAAGAQGTFGSPSAGAGTSAGAGASGSAGNTTGSIFGAGASGSGANGSGFGGSAGISGQSATSFSGTGRPIMGISSMAPGDSIVVLNEQTTYPTWEFLYDPRIEQLKAKSGIGASAGASGSGFGSSSTGSGFGGAPASGAGSTPFGGSGATPATPPPAPAPSAPTTPPQ